MFKPKYSPSPSPLSKQKTNTHIKLENMEPNLPVIGKKFWNIVRAALLILRKGISSTSKTKLMLDLNMMMKRGKIVGKALQNLMFHHHHSSPDAPGYYEFSCSKSTHSLFNNKRKHNHHAPPTEDDMVTVNAVVKALEIFHSAASSPALPGFGRSPAVRQVRVTDSPYPLRNKDDEDNQVDEAAEQFIAKFHGRLRNQNNMASR